MRDFINSIITELTTNESLKSNNLVNVVVESTRTAIASQVSEDHVYNTLKSGLTGIKDYVKSPELDAIIAQFEKVETTNDNKILSLYNEINLAEAASRLEKTELASDPEGVTMIGELRKEISGGTPHFRCYEGFVKIFNKWSHIPAVKTEIDRVSEYIKENREKLLMLDAIHSMGTNKVYEQAREKLMDLLIKEEFTAGTIRMELGSDLPIVEQLTRNLKVLEGEKEDGLNLGYGNGDSKVHEMISPVMVDKDSKSTITFFDDKFFEMSKGKIQEKNDRNINIPVETKDFTLTELNPKYVQSAYGEFYKVAECFYSLGFKPTADGSGVVAENLRNLDLRFVKEGKDGALAIYMANEKVDPSNMNFTEAFAGEMPEQRERARFLFERLDQIANLGFIKRVVNERMEKTSYIIKIGESFHVCDTHYNDRAWHTNLNELKVYKFMLENYNYDISPIYKTKIDDERSAIKDLDTKKANIEVQLGKLEESLEKVDKTLNETENLSEANAANLETLKENLEKTINKLRGDWKELDLSKKKELTI